MPRTTLVISGFCAVDIYPFGPVHTYPAAGNFNIKLSVFTSKACLNKSVTKSLDLQLLNIQASPDQQIDQGQHVQLNVAGGGTHFSWSPVTWLSNPSIANPVASPRIDIFYIVTVTNDLGCKDTDTVFIKVNPIPGIYVPTAFTPNNDGINDIFKPTLGEDFTLKDFSIYNRWGQKIFSTIQKGVGWNGKINGIVQNSGVYVWIVAATDITGKLEEKKGTLILIR